MMSEKEEYSSTDAASSPHNNSVHIDAPYYTSSNSISFQIKTEYIKSVGGIVSLLTKVTQFAGFISAATAIRTGGPTYPERDCYLAFSIIGFLFSILIYIIYLTNLNNHSKLQAIPLDLTVFIADCIWIGFSFLLGCLVSSYSASSVTSFNGSLGVAAFFAFLATIFYFGIVVYNARDLLKRAQTSELA